MNSLRVFALSLGAATVISGCSTFHGPGDLQVGGSHPGVTDPETVVVSPSGSGFLQPNLALNGERAVSHENQTFKFDWPLDDARMTRGFLAAASRRKRPHWGVDLANRKGTSILASERGTVIYTGNAFKGYGRLVVVEHNEHWATLYAHLDKILVKEGQAVTQGEKIAQMGRTGRASGVHLHFEIRHYRQPVNPLAHLPMLDGVAPNLGSQGSREGSRQWTRQASRAGQQADR